MSKFYFFVWFYWAVRVFLSTLILACGFDVLITLGTYLYLDLPELNTQTNNALVKLLRFWFPITLSISFLIALFYSLKSVFNRCTEGYKFVLLTCLDAQVIENVSYKDLIKVFRKWLMLIIWLVGAEVILSFVFMKIVSDFESIFEWFSIYTLLLYVFGAAYISFFALGIRCKRARIVRC